MRKLLLILASAAIFMTTAQADELKIGVINMPFILQKSPQMETINKDLKKQFKARQEKVLAAQKELSSQMEKFNRDGPVMSENDREKMQTKMHKDKRRVTRLQEEYRDDLNIAQNTKMKEILDKVDAVVQNIAQKGHYDIILQREGIPYVDTKKIDISNQVLAQLSKK